MVVALLVHSELDTSQHTPKPAAHVPWAEPEREVHSVEVTQVPVRPPEVVQASLGNWTTENSPMGLGAELARPRETKIPSIVTCSQ